MEEHELLVVKWVNDLLGGRFVVPPHVVMETIVVLALIVFFAILRTRFSIESPGRLQHALRPLLAHPADVRVVFPAE